VAQSAPELPRAKKHADVAAFMKTDLGVFLTERTFWVPDTSRPWVLSVLAVLLVAPGVGIGLLAHPPGVPASSPPQLVRHVLACAWVSPVAVLSAAWLAEIPLLQPMLWIVPAFGLLFGVMAAIDGRVDVAAKLAGTLGAFLWLLWALDLYRLRACSAGERG
jgi:hypothetical protein